MVIVNILKHNTSNIKTARVFSFISSDYICRLFSDQTVNFLLLLNYYKVLITKYFLTALYYYNMICYSITRYSLFFFKYT